MEDDWVETQWTDGAREAYRARAEALLAALRDHVELTSARAGRQRELAGYFASTTALDEAARQFVDAEFAWCGSIPMALAAQEGEDDEGEEESLTGPFLSVEGRWDFRITDETALVEAGRLAYLAAWPEDTAEDAALYVDGPAAAAGEIMHGVDVAALDDAPGLEPVESATRAWTHDGEDDDEHGTQEEGVEGGPDR